MSKHECESEVCNEVDCIKIPDKDYISTPGILLDHLIVQRQQQVRNTNRLQMIEKKIDSYYLELIQRLSRIEDKIHDSKD